MKKKLRIKKKPNIRHFQMHRDGKLYIQFYENADPFEMASLVVSNTIRYDFEEESGSKVIITGNIYKRTKIGVILSDWNIRRV